MRVKYRLITLVMFLLMVLAFAAACERPQPQQQKVLDDAYFVQVEKTPGKDPPSSEAVGLRQAEIVKDDVPVEQHVKDSNCPFWVETFVRAETGTDCNTYRAEIAGSSRRCVTGCDEKARLAEAITSARLTCADFCKQKNCPGPRYQPPEKCAVSRCLDSTDCPAHCPKLNTCYLLQGEQVWNCICLDA